MPVTLSPTEKPDNLEKVVSILDRIAGLGYIGRLDTSFNYADISAEIDNRFKQAGQTAHSRFELDDEEKTYHEVWSSSPRQALLLMTPPYPIQIELVFDPNTWTDGIGTEGRCQLDRMFNIHYWIKLNGGNNYYIAKEPESLNIRHSDYEALPELKLRDGLPLLCMETNPCTERCAPRLREINQIFNMAGLPKDIEHYKRWRNSDS